MWRGLRPGCSGHHCWLGPHHLLPEALLKWYIGASGGAGGLRKLYSGAWAGMPGLYWAWGGLRVTLRPFGGEAILGTMGTHLVVVLVTHTIMCDRVGFE